jgi:hypothetical protein
MIVFLMVSERAGKDSSKILDFTCPTDKKNQRKYAVIGQAGDCRF